MNLKKMGSILLNILNKDKFETDDKGHLVLTSEQKGKINESFKFSKDFASTFEKAWNEKADNGSQGTDDETALNVLNEAVQMEVAEQVKTNQVKIESEMQKRLNAKVAELDALKKENKTLQDEKQTLSTEKENLATAKADLEQKVEILSDETESDTEAVTIEGKKVKQNEFKADRKLFHNKMAFEYLEKGYSSMWDHVNTAGFTNKQMGGDADDTIDVSEINQEFGIYLTSQRKLEIFRELLRPIGSRKYMTKKLAIEEWRASQSQMTEIVQQFIAKWTPKGQAKFTPIVIKNRRHKINLPIVPDDITGGWLTYLYNEGVTPDQMPVTKYVIEVLLREQIDDDIEFNMVATGEYEELGQVTENDEGQAASKAMDGFITILKKQKADAGTKMNFFTPDGYDWSKDNSIQFMLDYAKFIKANPYGVKLHAKGMNAFIDPDMWELYAEKYQETYPFTKNEDKAAKIDRSNLTFVPLENMRGSGVIFSTPKSNFIELHHKNEAGGATKLFLQVQNYEVRVFGEFWLSVGFAIAEFVFGYVPVEASGSGA